MLLNMTRYCHGNAVVLLILYIYQVDNGSPFYSKYEIRNTARKVAMFVVSCLLCIKGLNSSVQKTVKSRHVLELRDP